MKVLHAALICLMIFAIFSYTAAATLRPLIQQDNNMIPKEKTALYSSLKARAPKEKPGLITLGDPIVDPIPNKD